MCEDMHSIGHPAVVLLRRSMFWSPMGLADLMGPYPIVFCACPTLYCNKPVGAQSSHRTRTLAAASTCTHSRSQTHLHTPSTHPRAPLYFPLLKSFLPPAQPYPHRRTPSHSHTDNHSYAISHVLGSYMCCDMDS